MIGNRTPQSRCTAYRNSMSGARPMAERGFSLIEVLVAVVVLSFGLLGMVGVQAFALQANRDSRQQAQAANLARELSDLMRGNFAVAQQAGNPYLFDSNTGAINESCLSVANAANGCANTTLVASSEMMDWLVRVNQALPGARIVVCFDQSPYDSSGLPRWTCDSSSMATQPTAVIKLGWTRNALDRSKTGDAVVERANAPNSRPYIIVPVSPN